MGLPLVLAGPIVRRVDARVASVWVALSQGGAVELLLWQGVQFSSGPGTVSTAKPPAASGLAATRKFGVNLHVALVEIDVAAAGGLLPGTYYAYDLVVTPLPAGQRTGLRGLGLLRDETGGRIEGVDALAPRHLALGYDEDRLPGFVTPAARLENLKLAHGSCRRPGYNAYDATGWLDEAMAADRNNTAKWPQQHFLTGDQIYADDVATPMLPMLMRLGREVVGEGEMFPITGKGSFALTPENFPAMRRALIARDFGGMTSVESHNHLLGYSEFVAMYLAVWSPRVWSALGRDSADGASELLPAIGWEPDTWPAAGEMPDGEAVPEQPVPRGTSPPTYAALTPWEAFFLKGYDGWAAFERGGDFTGGWREREKPRKNVRWRRIRPGFYPFNPLIREQQAAVVKFREIVPKVARVLANCSTYMILDDHEVTDDWNAYGRWMARVYSRDTGRAIVRNAMAAYTVFQGWGNDPEAFRSGNSEELLDNIEEMYAQEIPGAASEHLQPRIQELLGFPDARPEKRAVWHFSVDGPAHRIVVLDTRTLRDPGSYDSFTPAKILGESIARQLPEGPLRDGRELLVLVSAGPVLNPAMLDNVARPLMAGFAELSTWNSATSNGKDLASAAKRAKHRLTFQSGNAFREVESWATDPLHLERLLARLAAYERVLILSGDVHLSNSMEMDYWRRLAPAGVGDPDPPPPDNPGDPLPPIPQVRTPTTSRFVQLTSSGVCNGWEAWQENAFRRHQYFQDLPAGVFVAQLGWHQLHGLLFSGDPHIPPARKARLESSPALVPVSGWPEGTRVNMEGFREGPNAAIVPPNPPDWAWRLRLVSDQRPRSERVDAAEPPELPVDAAFIAAPLQAYAEIVAAHAVETMRGPRLMRTMNFTPNIGLVSFEPGSFAASRPRELFVVHRLLSAASNDLGRFGFGVVTEHRANIQPTIDPEPAILDTRPA